jgi:hypothetical protein
MEWAGPWRVIYAPCKLSKGGRSYGMDKATALNYLNMFEDAIYIERVIKIFKWKFVLRKYKCKSAM